MIEIRNGESSGLLFHHQGWLHNFQYVCACFVYIRCLRASVVHRGGTWVVREWYRGGTGAVKLCGSHLLLLWPRLIPEPGAI